MVDEINYCMIPMVGENTAHTKYIEIYIYSNCLSEGAESRRFILRRGYRLKHEQEYMFLSMLKQKPIFIDRDIFEKFAGDISEYFPELNWTYSYEQAEKYGIEKIFSHIYFTLWRSGTLELLYKVALPNLAFAVQMEKVENINISASNPKDIFGMPLHLLRIIDAYGEDPAKTSEYAVFMESFVKVNRLKMKAVFTKYRDFIEKNIPTAMQWLYLEKIYDLGVESKQELDQSTIIYGVLGISRCIKSLDRYILFQKRQRTLAEYFPFRGVPAERGVERRCEEQELILKELKEEKAVNNKLKRIADTCNLDGFQDEAYVTTVPSSLKEITREAYFQNNCLIECGYVKKITDGDCILVFIRKKKKNDKSFITVEISSRERKIVQALRKNNQILTERQLCFLEAFARARNLKYDRLCLCRMDENE